MKIVSSAATPSSSTSFRPPPGSRMSDRKSLEKYGIPYENLFMSEPMTPVKYVAGHQENGPATELNVTNGGNTCQVQNRARVFRDSKDSLLCVLPVMRPPTWVWQKSGAEDQSPRFISKKSPECPTEKFENTFNKRSRFGKEDLKWSGCWKCLCWKIFSRLFPATKRNVERV